MSDTHVVHRFSFETICAGVLRLIVDPLLFSRYKNQLDQDWFFYNDNTDQVRNLREVIKLLKTAHQDGGVPNMTVEWLADYLTPRYVDSTRGQEIRRSLLSWYSNDEIKKRISDDGMFDHFINYLKIVIIARDSKSFFELYQKGEPDQAAEKIGTALAEVASVGRKDREILDPMNILSDLRITSDKKHGYAMYLGCEGLDSQIGGFEKQTLNLFISVTNGGKTMLAHHLIRQCLTLRIPAFVACVEDRKDSFIRKAVACYTGIPMSALKRPNDLTQSQVNQIEEFMRLFDDYIRVEFMYGDSVDTVHKAAMEYDMECKLRGQERKIPIVNIVDYTGHIAGRSLGDKTYEKMRCAYGARKDYALKHKKICFDFAQVNREGGKKLGDSHHLTQTDLAGAFDIAQVCDNIITINRGEKEISTQTCVLYLTKCRDGAAGVKIRVGTDFSHARYNMKDWDIENAPANVAEELQALREKKPETIF